MDWSNCSGSIDTSNPTVEVPTDSSSSCPGSRTITNFCFTIQVISFQNISSCQMARDEMGKEIVEEQSDDDIPSTRSSALVPEVLTYYLIIVFCFRNLKWSDSQPPPGLGITRSFQLCVTPIRYCVTSLVQLCFVPCRVLWVHTPGCPNPRSHL